MKKSIIIATLLSLIVLPSLGSVSLANELCGQISTHTFSKKSERNRIMLEKHNGKRLKVQSTEYRHETLNAPRTLSLSPGYHEFLTAKGTLFGIVIKANKKYALAQHLRRPKTLIPSKKFKIVINSIRDIQCNSSKILPAMTLNKH